MAALGGKLCLIVNEKFEKKGVAGHSAGGVLVNIVKLVAVVGWEWLVCININGSIL